MRRFVLEVEGSTEGLSGTGILAEGIVFTDGRVAVREIVGDHRATLVWDRLKSVEKMYAGLGATVRIIDDR